MDPTTLISAILVAIGLLGADTLIYSGSLIVDVAPPPKIDGLSIDQATLEVTFEERLNEIVSTSSVVRPPEVRPSSDQGVGMALAQAAGVRNVALALEDSIGYRPDRLRLALYTEGGKLHGLVSGYSHYAKEFRTIMTPDKDETVVQFVHRCALWGASELVPYSTTLYLLEQHAADKDFTDAVALSEHVQAMLPPLPHSPDRALFENIAGLVALFKNDQKAAYDAFDAAMRSDPANPVPFLNAAFTDVQSDNDQRALDRMEQLIRLAPPANPTLLATAYMTAGAALISLKDYKRADQMLARAADIDPTSATVFGLWSEEKALAGDKAEAARLMQNAMVQTATFENYAEVAALYFHLAWGDNQPVTRSQFANPTTLTFH
jgi:tetratricopeptide (TPR) repeat protein